MTIGEASREQMRSLEDELRYTKENLQATIEELETSNEELQATNEELVASNEELQSTNEELHSVNEELYTVNAEYQRKISELTELTEDMDNLLHSTDVGVIFLDEDLCIRKFTPKMSDFFDLLPQDVGRRISSFAHNLAYDSLLDDVASVLRDKKPVVREVQDHQGHAFLLRTLPYRGKLHADGVVITMVDVSSLKDTERQLRRMSKVFQDGADPIIIESLKGRILECNAAAEQMYGWTRDELLGEPIRRLWASGQHKQAQQWRQQCQRGEPVRNVESVRRLKSGDVQPVLLTFSLLTDEDGQPSAIATIAKDITDRKRSEEQAREAVKRRDQFLAILSHELRNPLAAVLNAVSLLRHQDVDRDQMHQACDVIGRQTEQMARLLDDLLDVSRVTQGKIRLRSEPCEMNPLIQDTVEVVQPMLQQRGHELELDLDDEPLFAEGDSTRLLQIHDNLLSNAAKYTPPGGKITCSLRREGNEVVTRIRDNGEGIDEQMLPQVFDLFVQSESPLGRTSGGMGVGLTLVRNLVELHGGSVTAHSDGPGRGSEFVVRLPISDKRPVMKHPQQKTPSLQNSRIVIVEDNQDSREMLKSLLELDGFQVETANDGASGLEQILQNRPDFALVDIGLPEIDGYEVARRVQATLRDKRPCLVALTGYGRAEDAQAAREAGFDEHLVKPVNPSDLSRVICRPR
jgi:two-component system CheB/CheR fusion protein